MSQSTHVSKSPVQNSDVSLTEKLQARQANRATKAAERKQKSDKLKEEGNVFFRDGDYLKSAHCYNQAIQVHGDAAKPVLFTNLAAAYLKLDMYEEAHAAAILALEADPKSIKARFRRGVARRHMEMMTAAAVDFRRVLSLDPGNKQAKRELALVEEALPDSDECNKEGCRHPDLEAPAPDEEGYLTDSMSESSDCEHAGNSVPCKFYNNAGCAKGRDCQFSHAPDGQSERDGLGRNVCIYYLMGICKLGAEKCNYSHSKEYLPKKGWWTTREGVQQAKKIYTFRNLLGKTLGLSPPTRRTVKKPSSSKMQQRSNKSSAGKEKLGCAPSSGIMDWAVAGLSDSDSDSDEE